MSYAEADCEVWTWLLGSPLCLTIYTVFILLSPLMPLWRDWDVKGMMTSLCTEFFKDNVSTDVLWERYTPCFFFLMKNLILQFGFQVHSVLYRFIFQLFTQYQPSVWSCLGCRVTWSENQHHIELSGTVETPAESNLITITWLASWCAKDGDIGKM